MNIFVLNWFTVTSDATKMPPRSREQLFRFGYDVNTVSNVIGFVMCFLTWYVCV